MAGNTQNMSIDSRAINSLMSPPEPMPLESFARGSEGPSMKQQTKPAYPTALDQFPSPPVSPATKNINSDIDRSIGVQDPILYPQEPTASTAPQPPLFSDDEEATVAQRVVDEHMAARISSPARIRDVSPPRRTDYLLALTFKSQVIKKFNRNPMAWLDRERKTLREDNALRGANGGPRKFVGIAPYPTNVRAPRPTAGITKPPRGAGIKATKPATSSPKAPRTIKAPRVRELLETPKNRGTTREDRDFLDLPDYCPPLDSLPNKANALKVEWKGAPLDIRDDPHRHLLLDEEVALAGNLRLDCATYLCSKRRLFQARVEALRIGKEFRKTDAQQACKIDVNKASRLWVAYDKVDWFNKKYFTKYL